MTSKNEIRISQKTTVLCDAPSINASDTSESSSDSYASYEQTLTQRSRKRRRLSSQSEESGVERSSSQLTTASRVKPRASGARSRSLSNIQKAIASNGKEVDLNISFATLNVAPWLIASLSAMAILRPTAIQRGCIPKILEGNDVIGGSKTGSGKTVAFAVPILQKWAEDSMGIFAVILTPTR